MSTIPPWAIIHSLEGDKLEENRNYNQLKIHGEYIHPDRFRYFHTNSQNESFTCGTKYNPQDNSNCVFCQGFKYNRPEQEVFDVANGIFSYPNSYDLNTTLNRWSNNLPAIKLF